ncbi:MAG: MFS transporter [Chloroflexi bacterium]|nr:MFS transporter [Chloroflexota bacterium]
MQRINKAKSPTPGRFYYGWIILGGSVLAMALGSGISFWAFGLYIDPMEQEFGWSRAEVSAGFSISLAISGLCGPLIGRWVDTRGARSAILFGAVMTAATYVLLATTSSLWQWIVYLSINAVFRQLMFFIPFQALISRWFDRRRGMALGILGTGFSLGGFVVLIMAFVIDEVGWEGSFIFSAVAVLVLFLPLSIFVLKNDPSDVGAFVDGESGEEAEERRRAGPRQGLTAREALKTRLFWLQAGAMTLFFFGVFGWLVHQIPFYESVGVDRSVAAILVTIMAAGGIFARLTFGFFVDRFQRVEIAAMGLLTFLTTAFVVLLINSTAPGITIFLIFWIIGSGGGPLLEPLLITRSFGLKHFATILGTLGVVETIGIVLSPTLTGLIFDSTGSYDLALAMLAAALATAFVLFYFASRLPHPVDAMKAPKPT